MNYAAIRTKLGQAGDHFTLEIPELTSSELQKALITYMPESKIGLHSIQVLQSDEQKIRVQGTGMTVPWTGMTVELAITPDEETEVALHIHAAGQPGWTFADSFPSLAATMFANIPFASTSVLEWSLREGITFEGSVEPEKALGAFAFLAPVLPLSFKGKIEAHSGVPKLALASQASASSIELGPFKLSNLTCTIGTDVSYFQTMQDLYAEGYIQLHADVQLGTLPLGLTAKIKNLYHSVLFVIEAPKLISTSLDALSSLLGNVSLDIPAEWVQDVKAIRLDRIEMLVNPLGDTKIERLVVEVDVDKQLDLLPNVLSFDGLQTVFIIDDPLTAPQLSGYITSDVVVGNSGIFTCRCDFGELSFLVYLESGSYIAFHQLFEKLTGYDDPSLPLLTLTGFTADFHPREGEFTSEVMFGDIWEVPFVPGLGIGELFGRIARKQGELSFEVSGVLAIADVPIQLSASYGGEEAGWVFAGETSDIELPIGSFVDEVLKQAGDFSLPSTLAGLTLTGIGVRYELSYEELTFHCETRFPIAGKPVDVRIDFDLSYDGNVTCHLHIYGKGDILLFGGVSLQKLDFALGVEQAQHSWNVGGELGFGLAGTSVTLAAEVHSEKNGGWSFGGSLAEGSALRLSDVAKALLPDGATMPQELPDLELSDVSLSVTPSTGAFSLSGECKAKWDMPLGLATGLAVGSVKLNIERTASRKSGEDGSEGSSEEGNAVKGGAITCTLELHGEGPVAIVDGFIFKSADLKFELDQDHNWTLSGAIAGKLFETDYTLSASLETTEEARIFTFKAAFADLDKLLHLDGVGSLDIRELSVTINQQLKADAKSQATDESGTKAVQLQEGSPYTWSVEAKGRILFELLVQADIAGSLRLFQEKNKAGLVFQAEHAELALPLPIPDQNIAAHLALGSLVIIRQTKTDGESRWGFEGSASVWCTGLPSVMQAILADKVTGSLKIDDQGIQVSVDRLLKPIPIKIPDIDLGGLQLQLGTGVLDASNLAIGLRGSALSLSFDFGFGIPSELNSVLGKDAEGHPLIKLFRTYQESNPDSIIKLRLALDTEKGLSIRLLTSPFEAVTFYTEGSDTWCKISLGQDGDFGEFKFLVPSFSFDGASFSAKGGFQQVKPLRLPLKMIKGFLEGNGLGAATAILPDYLEFKELNFFDDNNHLMVTEFVHTLEQLGGFQFPQEFVDAMKIINDQLDQLPDQFKNYFKIGLPDGFRFDISVTGDGGVRIKISVDGDRPLKFIIPQPEGLIGVELHSLTFGEALGGAVFLLDMDIRIDMFDFITLATTLLLPPQVFDVLPNPRTLQKRIVIKKLFMLIIYQTQVPIPVPLFYDEIGIEYLGIEGVEFRFSLRFPKPKINFKDAAKMFTSFYSFFTKPEYLLKADEPPKEMDLRLTMGPSYVQLPKYFNNDLVLGTKADAFSISAYTSIAHVLNTLKTMSLNELIQAIPMDIRVGHQDISFGAMSMNVAWLLTTPQEFRDGAYTHIASSDSESQSMLQVLPPSPSANEQGLVLFLKGDWSLDGLGSLQSSFGLVGTSSGFATGMRAAGRLSNLLDVELKGDVIINPKSPANTFSLQGHSHLRLHDAEVFRGDLTINDKLFHIDGQLDLIPGSELIRMTGRLIGRISKEEFYLFGDASIQLGSYFTLARATAELTPTTAKLAGTWFGQTLMFVSQLSPDSWRFTATMSEFSIGDLVRITGAGNDPQPIASIQINADKSVELYVSGQVKLFGLVSETQLYVRQDGMHFSTRGSLFNLFQASLTAHATSTDLSNADFFVTGEYEQQFSEQLKAQVTEALQVASSHATAAISAEQAKVDAAIREVQRLDELVEATKQEIDRQQNEARRGFDQAVADLQNAQNEVNRLQYEIDMRQDRIRNLQWYEYILAPFIGIEIAGIEIARGTAMGALLVSQGVLETARSAISVYPVDLDPRVTSIVAAKVIAETTLQGANLVLEGVKQTVGTGIQVANYLAQAAIDTLFIVKRVRFSAYASHVTGSQMTLLLDISFMGNDQSFDFLFDFNNIPQSVKNMADKFLK
ncbi:coiled-coil domain-containing protein [Cohnella faecalis]|uniref:Uncharacterized protein n=1 Tax=Cohnella faecalis TaxID=2315694 RepID=A0A398CYL7_9BACL|nr:hypothetical protein [Cohnella faecalis]RIE04321.1 hypothetical protein D3H35_06880 [Cohnella faecalis]